MKRIIKQLGALSLASGMASTNLCAQAQQTFKLTVGASHPATLPWVGLMSTVFIPEVNKRVAALNKGYKIEWSEAYGGQLYKANATLTSVGDGIADIGWVFHNLEGAKMPLNQVSVYAPGVTDDPKLLAGVVNELVESTPALRQEWEKNNVVFLGASTGDTYHMFTKFPLRSVSDLNGRKISAPGVVGAWLRGTGAIAVDGTLTTYYTDLQTGVSDGALSITTGVVGARVYEVAPVISKVGLGSTYYGAMAINRDTWNKLPTEIRAIMKDAGKEYSRRLGDEIMRRYGNAFKMMAESKQVPPVVIIDWPVAERAKWFGQMPNLAQEWVKTNEAKGLPARAVLNAYMETMRRRGATPLRAWDKP